MRPEGLRTKIFLDSGDPDETMEALSLMGFLDGQTTNPTLIARNPEVSRRLELGQKFSEQEVYGFYRKVVSEIASLIPEGSVSVEVYSDSQTTEEQMFEQSSQLFEWIPNAHIKFPITLPGLRAAQQATVDDMRVNMTLCFSQEQAAAVHAATKGAKTGDVFVSPFVGRLDDIGLDGMDLVTNIMKMYEQGKSHVQILVASVRTPEHFMRAIQLEADIVTAPLKILKGWVEADMKLPDERFSYSAHGLNPIPYQDLDLSLGIPAYNVTHELTDRGMDKFTEDWKSLIK